MQNSKLITTLKLLKQEEIQGVNRLLLSELLIKGSAKRECETLFNFILPFYPNFDNEALAKENILQEIFKDSDSKINRLEKTMTALLQVVEYYIVHFVAPSEFENLRSYLVLAKFYREKDLPLRGDLLLFKAEQELKDQEHNLAPEYYYWLAQYKEEKVSIKTLKGEKNSSEEYADLFSSSFEYSILLSIESLSKMVFLQYKLDDNTNQILLDLEQLIQRNEKLQANILISLHLLSLNLFKNIEKVAFFEILIAFDRLFDKYYKTFNESSAYFFSTAKRICISAKHNYQSDNQSLFLLVNNYKKDLEAGFLFVEGFMHSITAVNIVNNTLKLKENDWVKGFLEQYGNQIGFPYENRAEILKFCWAQYYFSEKQYDKAEENITVYYENLFYFINIRRMQLKIYFEKQEYFVLESELEALKIYVYRQFKQKQSISEDFFNLNNNFVDALKQIYGLTFKVNATKKKNLIQKITSGKYSDQDWLLEKVNALKT